jgi:serine protease inhibitor
MPSEWERLVSKSFLPSNDDEYGPFAEKSFNKPRSQPPDTVARPKRAVHRDLLAASTKLGLTLHQKLAQASPGINLVVSPISVNLAMAMAVMGAHGETRSEMGRVLGLDGIAENEWGVCYSDLMENLRYAAGGQELSIANSIWVTDRYQLQSQYEQALKEHLAAEAMSLRFSDARSVARINQWVDDKTKSNIREIVDSLSDEQRLMLINCVYFKGLWYQPFDAKRTRDNVFHGRRGDQQRPFMHMRNHFVYWEDAQVQVVRLDYAGFSRLSLWVFLPSQQTGLEEFVRGLRDSFWESVTKHSETRPGTLALPRFKLECSEQLIKALRAAGMECCFDPGRADFSGMLVEREPLFISEVLQKTYLEVNEQGTEAAAATRVVMARAAIMPSEPPKPFEMVVDRPFFVALGDAASGVLLFTASVWEP